MLVEWIEVIVFSYISPKVDHFSEYCSNPEFYYDTGLRCFKMPAKDCTRRMNCEWNIAGNSEPNSYVHWNYLDESTLSLSCSLHMNIATKSILYFQEVSSRCHKYVILKIATSGYFILIRQFPCCVLSHELKHVNYLPWLTGPCALYITNIRNYCMWHLSMWVKVTVNFAVMVGLELV